MPLYLLIGINSIKAQALFEAASARYLTIGTYSAQNLDIAATRTNPASLAQLKKGAVAIFGERRFQLENLDMYAASAGLPTSSGNFAIHGSYFGFELSNRSQLSLAYGRKVNSKMDLGAAFHYLNIKQAGIYGGDHAITGSLSLLMHLTNTIHAGLNAYNPIKVAYGKNREEQIPAQYSFGIGYDVSDKLYVSGELVKSESQDINVNAGMQYRFVEKFLLRLGIATLTSNYYGGFGFLINDFRVDIAASYHPQLGFSPGLMLLYEFGTKHPTVVE